MDENKIIEPQAETLKEQAETSQKRPEKQKKPRTPVAPITEPALPLLLCLVCFAISLVTLIIDRFIYPFGNELLAPVIISAIALILPSYLAVMLSSADKSAVEKLTELGFKKLKVDHVFFLLFSSLFFTPKMFRLADEKRELKLKYEILQSRIRSSQRQIEQIRHRDNYVYRPLFASDTLAIEGIYNPYDDSKYAAIWGDEYSPVMVQMWHEMDQLAR